MSKDDFIDVNFTESDTSNEIKGKPLYYTTGQVAIMLDITDSAVRYYCTKFKDMLNLEMSGSHRKFKDSDIEKLRYIKKLLKEDGLSVSQVQEYGSEKDISVIEDKISKQDPLALQSLATALTLEMSSQLEDFKLIMSKELESHKNMLKEMVTTTVDEVVTEKIDIKLNEFKSFLDAKELEAKNRDLEMIDLMKNNMEKRKEANLKEKKSGFLSKIFRR